MLAVRFLAMRPRRRAGWLFALQCSGLDSRRMDRYSLPYNVTSLRRNDPTSMAKTVPRRLGIERYRKGNARIPL